MGIGKKLRQLGPGLITGAADDDPSGIATYSQAGAQFGTSLMWTLVLCYPLMVAVQLASARVGRVTGKGLAHSLKTVMPRWLVILLALLLFAANTINVGADLAAMGEAGGLVAPINKHLLTGTFAVISLFLQLRIPYHRYASWLKWLTLVLFAYVALLFMVKIDGQEVVKGMIIPRIAGKDELTTIVAIFGTTISPYLFFWQAAQEVEEIEQKEERKPLTEAEEQGGDALRRIRWDTFAGMAVSNIVALAIILGTAATLHHTGKTDIQSAADAAKALQPVAGNFAFAIFCLGIVGTGLLAVPVLAGSSAYGICEIGGWNASLEAKPHRAKAFYFVIVLGVLLSIGIDWSPFSPMKALFWSAVLNGIAAVPVLVGLMIVVARKQIMKKFVAPPALRVFGWLATVVMAAAVAAMFATAA
ncbi:NRAMP (natural resistance-associated macrophage protein)-like metal ion transporter [Novosphingobium sp. PhB165]|uniref:Nramp family divalent metal transporter n=1 Tax=Novosphingobium sp. PhB165 TaxID=2485105 RepID=UPI00104488D9|nr:Nramp family divalent metal transporter [Novosphingobium sp. PhB165]TCM14358.1 NRAMP (natural resistance-associated macrophage protein)-like metal ion transporter [Novosphingobium sp. PhB165]